MAMEATAREATFTGEKRPAHGAAPIDLVHLARQTFGSDALEREILRLFVAQSRVLVETIAVADPAERRPLAHRLKGSALGVGAGRMARLADAIESEAGEEVDVRRAIDALAEAFEEVRAFVATIV